MPFVKKNPSQGSQSATDDRKIFIGRTGELLFFVQNILKSEEPTHNIISVWGQGGVGKSTLLSRFIDEAHSADFKGYCMTAIVDERQTTPISIMEKFAEQLQMQGAFEKALKQYKEALRKLQTEQETLPGTLLQNFAGAAIEGVPYVGPLLGEGFRVTTEHLLDKYHTIQMRKDSERLEDPIDDLTRAFVEELNQLVDTQVLLGSQRIRNRRVILFFDTFEQLAAEATPWLLDYFLQADIKSNIVLVIAGRDPIEHSLFDYTKRWLSYSDNEIIYWISLNSFTEDETRSYLIKRNIIDPERIATIWQLSQGLPLYLSLLTVNPRGKVDPTADVVANFLRWIPEQEQVKRRLALDAALFSRPFNQDDLEAFDYLPEDERSARYRWLVSQPFVRSQDGRYSYHDLARELFARHLWQLSKKKYYTARRALANYYKCAIEEIEIQEDGYEEIDDSTEWLELTLALACQLLLLPDKMSHIQAVEYVLKANRGVKQRGEVVRILRELSQEQFTNKASAHALEIARKLLEYIEADLKSQEFITAANFLLEKVVHEPTFSSKMLAAIQYRRGLAYRGLKDYQKAITEFNCAITLHPNRADFYRSRGKTYRYLKDYQRAIEDFNQALELNPKDSWVYYYRGYVYNKLDDYQRAIEDFNRALELNPDYHEVYATRGYVYGKLKDYQKAIKDFDRALELNPKYVLAYSGRGSTYLRIKDTKQAQSNYANVWELDPTHINYPWMAQWCEMCQERPDPGMAEQLETIAAIDPQDDMAGICRGVALWLHHCFDEALIEFEQVISSDSNVWDAYFWKGMACASLGQEEEAMAAIKMALEIGLPPVLLTPLRWFKQDRPDFYQKYVVPLMTRYDGDYP